MNDFCNLCCKKLDNLSFDVKSSKSEQSGMHFISLIEIAVDNFELLQNIAIICKECNEVLLELDALRSRMIEIQNVIRGYIEKKEHFIVELNASNLNENKIKDVKELSPHKQNHLEFELIEEIVESNSQDTEGRNDTISHNCLEIIDQKKCATKVKKERKIVNKKPKVEHICHCTKLFQTKHELTKHLRTHNNESPYVCEICGQAYKQKMAFDTHIKMHEGLNPFTCVYCNKSFTQKVALIRHVPMHTGKL